MAVRLKLEEAPDRPESQVVSRFTIAILSSQLIAMGIGRFVPSDLADLSIAAGIIGFVAYLTCLASADRRRRSDVAIQKVRSENRLSIIARWDRFCGRRLATAPSASR